MEVIKLFLIIILAPTSLKSSLHQNLGGLQCLNPDRTCEPFLVIDEECGNIVAQMHYQSVKVLTKESGLR